MINNDSNPYNTEQSRVIDDEGFEKVNGLETGDRSPDGKPGDPKVDKQQIHWLIAGAFIAVAVLAVVAWIFFGIWIGLVVLVLGLGFGFVGNPAIWSANQRAKERPEDPDEQAAVTRHT